MKPRACLTVCLLFALAVVLTPSPGASAFSIHLGSTGSYAGDLGAPSPRADSQYGAWSKPLAPNFWRRRRRGSTSRSPDSSGAEMNLQTSPFGFGAADDEGGDEAKLRRMAKLEIFHAKMARMLGPNSIVGFSAASKLHMRDPFEETAASSSFNKGFRRSSSTKDKHQGRRWQKTSDTRQDSSHRVRFDTPRFHRVTSLRAPTSALETSSSNDGWSRAAVEDFDVATKIREAIDILAESERSREMAEREGQEEEFGTHAELPAGSVPPINNFPTPEHIPARPIQSQEPARRQEEQSEKEEPPMLLQTHAADSNDPLLVVNKAASKPAASDPFDSGTWTAPRAASFPDQTRSDFESLFLADPKGSKGKETDLFGRQVFEVAGGSFDTDVSACDDIFTRTCSSDADCSCNGYYRCKQGMCGYRSETHSSDVSGRVGNFEDEGRWYSGPIQTSRKRRQQPAHSTRAEAAAKATAAAATRSTKAEKGHVDADLSDSHKPTAHSLRKRKEQAGSDVSAVHAAQAAADVKGAKRQSRSPHPPKPRAQ